jgi:hypothetical protein
MRVERLALEPSNETASLSLGSTLQGDGLELIIDRAETRRVLTAATGIDNGRTRSVALIDEFARDVLVRSAPAGKAGALLLPWSNHETQAQANRPEHAHVYLFARVHNATKSAHDFPFAIGASTASTTRTIALELGATGRLVAVLPEDAEAMATGDETCDGGADSQPLAPGETRALLLVIDTDLATARQRNMHLGLRFAGDTASRQVLLRSRIEHASMLATEQVLVPLLAALHAGQNDAVCKLLASGASCEHASQWISQYQTLERLLGRHALTVDHRLTRELQGGGLEISLRVTSPCELRAEGYAECLRTALLPSHASPLTLRLHEDHSGVHLQSAQLQPDAFQRVELERELAVAARFGVDCWVRPLRCKGDVVECLRDDQGLSIVLDDSGRETHRTTFDVHGQILESGVAATAPQTPSPPRENETCFDNDSLSALEMHHRRAFSQMFAPRCDGRLRKLHHCFGVWEKLHGGYLSGQIPSDPPPEYLECGHWDFDWPDEHTYNFRPDNAGFLESMSVIPLYETGHWMTISRYARIPSLATPTWAMLWIYSEPWATVSIGKPLGDRELTPDQLLAESDAMGLTPLLYTGLRLPAGEYAVTLRTADGRTTTRDINLSGGAFELLNVHIGHGEHARSWTSYPDGTLHERTWVLSPDGTLHEREQ